MTATAQASPASPQVVQSLSQSQQQNVTEDNRSLKLSSAYSEQSSRLAAQIAQLLPMLASQAQSGGREKAAVQQPHEPAPGGSQHNFSSGGENTTKIRGRQGIHQSRHLVRTSLLDGLLRDHPARGYATCL